MRQFLYLTITLGKALGELSKMTCTCREGLKRKIHDDDHWHRTDNPGQDLLAKKDLIQPDDLLCLDMSSSGWLW